MNESPACSSQQFLFNILQSIQHEEQPTNDIDDINEHKTKNTMKNNKNTIDDIFDAEFPTNPPSAEISSKIIIAEEQQMNRYFTFNGNTEDIQMQEMKDAQISQTSNRKTFKCYNCGNVGHIARNCTFEQLKICFKCGDVGHTGFYCMNDPCLQCLQNHKTHECQKRTQSSINIDHVFCVRCGSDEHFVHKCQSNLDDQISNVRCYVCGKIGHLNCNTSVIDEKHTKMCSNCSSVNHYAYECKKQKMSVTDIVYGLSLKESDPVLCYHCLTADHEARNCPLLLRTKKQNITKFLYRNENSQKSKTLLNRSRRKKYRGGKRAIRTKKTVQSVYKQYSGNY